MEEEAEKEHEPTQKKLDDARRRGELVRSADLTAAAAHLGLLVAVAAFGTLTMQTFGTRAMVLIDQADGLSPLAAATDGTVLSGIVMALGLSLAAIFLLPPAFALVALFAQRALVFAPEKLAPRLSRIDPIANAREKFGLTGLVEFLKSTAKLVIVALLLGWYLALRIPRMLTAAELDARLVGRELCLMLVEFLALVVLVQFLLAVPDYLWQRFNHLRRNRMSRQELLDEFKQSEGDPHMKQQRRQRAFDIATNRMLADVKEADVVIVNPTHYAVALKWQRASGRAPVCVAKGVDEIAARIREAAMLAAVPIHSDPPTARALHASVEIGEEIRPDHYRAVAAAIRFAEKMRRRARGRAGGQAGGRAGARAGERGRP